MKNIFLKYWTISLVGLILLLPATYFMLTLFIRVFFGSTTLYYQIAPSFMERGQTLFPLHKSAWILYGPLLAVIINAAVMLKFKFYKRSKQLQVNLSYSKYWLNTAIAVQSILLFIILTVYLFVQHYRY